MNAREVKIVLGIVVLFFALKWWFLPPSEAQLKARFVEHRADFEELRVMFQHEASASSSSVVHIGSTSAEKDDGSILSSSRRKRCRTLMQKLGIKRIYGNSNRFRVCIFEVGFGDTSWSNGYAFASQKTTGSAYERFVRDTTIDLPLSANWYLYQFR